MYQRKLTYLLRFDQSNFDKTKTLHLSNNTWSIIFSLRTTFSLCRAFLPQSFPRRFYTYPKSTHSPYVTQFLYIYSCPFSFFLFSSILILISRVPFGSLRRIIITVANNIVLSKPVSAVIRATTHHSLLQIWFPLTPIVSFIDSSPTFISTSRLIISSFL